MIKGGFFSQTNNSKMNKKLHFISGLPRSGSTLLVSILNQNPRFYAEIQNPLSDIIVSAVNTNKDDPGSPVSAPPERLRNLINGSIEGYYSNINKEVIFNVSRAWTGNMEYWYDLNSNFKIICMVRDYVSILNSFEHVYKARGVRHTFLYSSNERNVYSRTHYLGGDSEGYLFRNYQNLIEAFYGPYKNHLLLVEYDDLVNNTSQTINKIYDFIGEEYYNHNLNEVQEESYLEYDKLMGMDLHKIRPQIKNRNLPMILPPDLQSAYKNWEFWRT